MRDEVVGCFGRITAIEVVAVEVLLEPIYSGLDGAGDLGATLCQDDVAILDQDVQ